MASIPLKRPVRSRNPSRKQQIVATVLELVAARGITAVSAQLVADAIGVTQPAVFRHFASMEALWLAVMDWLEERLVAIYSSAGDDAEPALVALSHMFLDHMRLVEKYPALAKLVFSDHLRLQYPSLQARFARIHKAYMARLTVIVERAKADGSVAGSASSKDLATTFLALVQGLGFQFAIAGLPMKLAAEAERIAVIYLQAIASSAQATERARQAVGASKNKLKDRRVA